ncbi:MAG: VOC family protein [Mycolicibacterium neoaurum]|nr:VOC family protein [Mycolicibacterium neoaurum]
MPNQTPVQVAWVTRDLDATEHMLTALLGAGKWTRMPGIHFGPDMCTLRGAPADFIADISLSYAGDLQLELIAPISGDSIYTEFLAASGPGMHHICTAAADEEAFADAVRAAEDAGAPVVMQGVIPGGMRFAYVGAAGAGVPYIEIAYIPPDIQAVFDYIKSEQQ